jgi:hypothetical protein
LAQSIEDRRTAVPIRQIGRLVHQLAFHRNAFCIGFCQPGSVHVVVPVDRTAFITMQVRPITSERDEVPQSEPVVTAPLQSRLSHGVVSCHEGVHAFEGGFGRHLV